MAAISSLSSPPNLSVKPTLKIQPKLSSVQIPILGFHKKLTFSHEIQSLSLSPSIPSHRLFAVAEETASVNTSSEAARRLYVGNIPRTVTNNELAKIVGEYGAVEKAEVMYDKYSGRSRRFAFVTMKTVEDANAAIEKLNGTEIGGREIKVNVTEKPLSGVDLSLQAEESQFVDSPHKVYVGNLAKNVTTETLKNFFSEKGNVLGAKVSRVPGTSKSTGFGFVSFSSEENVEAAISSFNNSLLEGQRIRVNKA
ncbi:30S ribosomal protein 2, chloroplastic [Morus notabilis]|uniref:30S ribosomal protein 2, chloroplastic n=1 Tax=Morus notabilis TaxID=981085 RepID=UPI000CED07F2|nr:30S ribosomal protein 2, chloroplastic [Morus notabilis]